MRNHGKTMAKITVLTTQLIASDARIRDVEAQRDREIGAHSVTAGKLGEATNTIAGLMEARRRDNVYHTETIATQATEMGRLEAALGHIAESHAVQCPCRHCDDYPDECDCGAGVARAAIATTPESPRFAETWCSQCGEPQGPGDAGFSHCEDHGGDHA